MPSSFQNRRASDDCPPARSIARHSLQCYSQKSPSVSGIKVKSKTDTQRITTSSNRKPSANSPPQLQRPQQPSAKSSSLGLSILKSDDSTDAIGVVVTRPVARDSSCREWATTRAENTSLNNTEIEQWERLIRNNDKSKVPITTSTSIESETSMSEWVTEESSTWSSGASNDITCKLSDSSGTLLDNNSSSFREEYDPTITQLISHNAIATAGNRMSSEWQPTKHRVKEKADSTNCTTVKFKSCQTQPLQLSKEANRVPSHQSGPKLSVTSRGDEGSAVNILRVRAGPPKTNWKKQRISGAIENLRLSERSNLNSHPRDGDGISRRQSHSGNADAKLGLKSLKRNLSTSPPSPRVPEPDGGFCQCTWGVSNGIKGMGHLNIQASHGQGVRGPLPIIELASNENGIQDDQLTIEQQKPEGFSYDSTLTVGRKCDNLSSENLHLTSDLTVIVGQRKFPSHKFVLYKSSAYFRALIRETIPGPLECVKLDDVPEDIFEVLYTFMYKGVLNVTHDNFCAVLDIGQKLEMPSVLHSLLEFLNSSFDATNAIFLYNGCKELREKAQSLLVSHFARLVKSTDFLRLPVGSLLQLLKDDKIAITSELDTFWGARRWLAHEWGCRKAFVKEVMLCVRFPLMSEEDLLACLQELQRWKMDECPEMKDLMMEAMTYKMYQKIGHRVRETQLNVTPRSSCVKHIDPGHHDSSHTDDTETVLPTLCDRHSTHRFANVDSFYISENEWSFHTSTSTILLVGGADPLHNGQCTAWQNQVHTMYLFDPSEERWKSIGLSPKPWHHPGIAHLNGVIYICGGSDMSEGPLSPGPSASAQAWCFNIHRGVWTQIPDMKVARIHHTLLAAQNKIYAIGGFDNKNRILNSVECYNPLVNRWEEMSSMPYECLGMAACEFQELFWICGGIIKLKSTTTTQDNKGGISDMVQVYNPRKNKWYMSSPLRMPRAFASLSAVNNRLFLIGGNSPPKPLLINDTAARSVSDIDVFDITWNEWRHYTDLFLPRHCCGSVSIGNHLYIFGGMSTALGEVLRSVERFDTIHRKWVCLSAELPIKLAGMGCVVIPPYKAITD